MRLINNKSYVYFLKGKYIILKESSDGSGSRETLSNPTENIEEGLLLDVARVPNFSDIDSENDILPIPEALEEAVVNYVKAQLQQDPNLIQNFMLNININLSIFEFEL